jgi:hypothetical protein
MEPTFDLYSYDVNTQKTRKIAEKYTLSDAEVIIRLNMMQSLPQVIIPWPSAAAVPASVCFPLPKVRKKHREKRRGPKPS